MPLKYPLGLLHPGQNTRALGNLHNTDGELRGFVDSVRGIRLILLERFMHVKEPSYPFEAE